MFNITKETLENNGIDVRVDSVNTFRLNEKNIEEKLGHKNLSVISNRHNKIYKKRRCELVNKPIKQSDRRFLHIDLALKIIMDCRTDKSCSFKKNLGFKLYDMINTKEQTIKDILTEILIMKLKDKKHQKKNLVVYLLELILMKKILIFLKK